MQAIGSGSGVSLRLHQTAIGGSAAGPSGTATAKVSLHAQEIDRVPSAGGVENAEVHCPGVQINAAIELVLLVVEAHLGLLWNGTGA